MDIYGYPYISFDLICTCDYMSYRITNNQFDKFKRDFNGLVELYRKEYSVDTETDWMRYEKEYAKRLQTAMKELKPIIREAYAPLCNAKIIGRPSETQIVDKVAYCF